VSYSREQISDWLDEYFRAVNQNQGGPELVAGSRRFFAEELEFWMYTTNSVAGMPLPLSREQLLLSFVHPGLHETITPNYYVIDVDTLKVVVQFQLAFRDVESGIEWQPRQASAHYHLKADADGGLQIAKIHYWTEVAQDDFEPILALWARGRERALCDFAIDYFKHSQ
jgi:hypothetical protein